MCACSRPQVFASVRRPYAPRTPVASDTTKAHGHSPPAAPAPQCRPAETNAMPPRAPGWPGRRPTGPAPMAQRGYAVRAALPFSRRRSVGALCSSAPADGRGQPFGGDQAAPHKSNPDALPTDLTQRSPTRASIHAIRGSGPQKPRHSGPPPAALFFVEGAYLPHTFAAGADVRPVLLFGFVALSGLVGPRPTRLTQATRPSC